MNSLDEVKNAESIVATYHRIGQPAFMGADYREALDAVVRLRGEERLEAIVKREGRSGDEYAFHFKEK